MIESFITGAGGFIGKRLYASLQGSKMPISHDEIPNMLFWLMPSRRFFFLSAYGNMAGQNDAAEIIRANIGDLGGIVSRMLKDQMMPTESFVYLSSSSVGLPVLTPYARAKRAAEEMIQATPLPFCIIRPFSVTGVGEQKEHLIPKLIHSCMTGTHMDIVLEPTHDYVDVADVVDGILSLSQHRAKGVFEFGSGVTYTNGEVLNLVEEITGKRANVRIVGRLRDYDNELWVCQNVEARKFGWNPSKTLAVSIKEMVEAYE